MFAQQLGRVVAHIDHLQEFESMAEVSDPASGVEAADEPQPDPRGSLFLDNAPDVRGRFFAVPRMRAGGGAATVGDLPDE